MPYRTMGNPVQAGIDAFTTLGSFFDRQDLQKQEVENLKGRREMMAIQTAEARLGLEEKKKNIEVLDKVKGILGEGIANDWLSDPDLPTNLGSALGKDEAIAKGEKPNYTDKEGQALVHVATHLPEGVVDLNELDKTGDTNNSFLKILSHLDPQINAPNSPAQIKITQEQYPELFSTFGNLYPVNKGQDRNGMSVEKDGVKKTVKAALIDKTTNPPTVSFVLDVNTPVKEGQVFQHIGDKDFSKFTVDPDGDFIKGNIDLNKRPVVRNKDGSIITVMSTSVEEDGKEVLIPRLSKSGKVMSIDEAVKEYRKTGEYLGKFKTKEEADAYAQKLHSDPMWDEDIKQYSAKGQEATNYEAPMTHDRGPDPNAEIVKLPIPILVAHARARQQFINRLQQYLAQLDPVGQAKVLMQYNENRKWNTQIQDVIKGIDKTKPPGEQMRQFISDFSSKHPEVDPKKVLDYAKGLYEKTGDMTPYQAKSLELRKTDVEGKEKDREEKRKQDEQKEKDTKEYREKTLKQGERKIAIEEKKVAKPREMTPYQSTQLERQKKQDEEKQAEKVSKSKKAFEKRMIDTYSETKGPDAPKTVNGLLKEMADNPKKKAAYSSIHKLGSQYIENGMDEDEAFEKAEQEVMDELKKRGIDINEEKPKGKK